MPAPPRFARAAFALLLLLACLAVVRAEEGIPRCVEDRAVYMIPNEDINYGTVTPRDAAACPAPSVRGLEVTVPPTGGSAVVAPPDMAWTYFFGAHSGTENQNEMDSFTLTATCDGKAVCQAMISFVIVNAQDSTTAAPTTAKPGPTLPTCSTGDHRRVHAPGETTTASLPFDAPAAACRYTAVLLDAPSLGTAVVMEPREPLHYVYLAPTLDEDATTTLPYEVHCNGIAVCRDTVQITIAEEAPACPVPRIAYTMKPGNELAGAFDVGASCSGYIVGRARDFNNVGSLSTIEDGTLGFIYRAPAEEDDGRFTLRTYCDGAPLCDAEVIFVVSESATSSTAPPVTDEPTTTTTAPVTPTPAPQTECGRNFGYDVPVGQTLRGKLFVQLDEEECYITTYGVARNFTRSSSADSAANLEVNIVGEFLYQAPSYETLESTKVNVYCVSRLACTTTVSFAVFRPFTEEPQPTTAGPTLPPVPTCANVYYYRTGPGVALSSSLNGMPQEDLCTHGRYFSMNTPPQAGILDMMPIGDFLYQPVTLEGNYDFTFSMYCLNKLHCVGTAYILVSNRWTLPPLTTAPTKPPVAAVTRPGVTCRGTCNSDAWLTFPKPPRWDTTPGAGYARKDGKPVDGVEVVWQNSTLVVTAYTLIGNLGVRFPTFEALRGAQGKFFEPADFERQISNTSTAFNMSCLSQQGRAGMGEDVWEWKTLTTTGSGSGAVGPYYNAGHSWYQKFGGKHVQCDTFADPCRFAPLLTPANVSLGNTTSAVWSIDVDDCDATWTGRFHYAAIESLRRADGSQVWSFVGDRQLKGTLLTEAVRPVSWIDPARSFEGNYDAHDILLNLDQFVVVGKAASTMRFSVDTEFFETTESNGDLGFGINMQVYPLVTPEMTTSYSSSSHVVGFKWISQEWESPSLSQCPTCTGAKTSCHAAGQFASSTYVGAFPHGDCPPGVGRVELHKGPAMTLEDCPENKMNVYNQPGFSPPRACHPTHQNITFRGVVKGSGQLPEHLRLAFNYEGVIGLQLLMADGSKENINLRLSMYVSRLSLDSLTTEGGLVACRSGNYWPLLDPLGLSVSDAPFELAVTTPESLCLSNHSSTYGPNDWAYFTLVLPGVNRSQVKVDSIVLHYGDTSVFLRYTHPATGELVVPPAAEGFWWEHTQPFLAYRDLSARLAAAADERAQTDAVFTFTFIPGAVNMNANVEVVVKTSIITEQGAVSKSTFSRMLHVDPQLTQRSRNGPPKPIVRVTRDNRSDLYAIFVVGFVAAGLVVSVIFFMVADNNRPLPRWVPRGKLIKETVLSVLPPGMRGKKKPKRIVHKDMYDAMNSGKY